MQLGNFCETLQAVYGYMPVYTYLAKVIVEARTTICGPALSQF